MKKEKKHFELGLAFVSLILCLPAVLVVLSFLDPEVVFTLTDAPLLFFLLNPLIAFYLMKLKKWAYFTTWASLILFCAGLMYMFWVFYINSGMSLEMWWHLTTTNGGYVRPVLFFTTILVTFMILLRKRSLFEPQPDDKPELFLWESED